MPRGRDRRRAERRGSHEDGSLPLTARPPPGRAFRCARVDNRASALVPEMRFKSADRRYSHHAVSFEITA